MTEPTPESFGDLAWQHLTRGKADRKHPARHLTLATIGPDGPELRTLVLRGVDRGAGVLELHTDGWSPKVAQIAADPRVALHVWIPTARLQLRMRAVADVQPGDPTLLASLPPEAQANYGGATPGTRIDEPVAEALGDPERFTRLLCRLTEIDVLSLGPPQLRARLTSRERRLVRRLDCALNLRCRDRRAGRSRPKPSQE